MTTARTIAGLASPSSMVTGFDNPVVVVPFRR
jgi:hypothetical protein